MKKNIAKKTLFSLAFLIFFAVIGYLMIVSVFWVFNIPERKTEETLAILQKEGHHQRESLKTGEAELHREQFPDVLNLLSDEYMIRYSMVNPSQDLRVYSLIPEYSRYWHGYIVILRPLFKFLNLSEIRILNMIVQLFLSIYFAYLIHINTNKRRYLLAWASIYAVMIPNAIYCNFQYSIIFYVALILSIVLLSFKAFFLKDKNYIYLFLFAGMATAYFDFLTYPVLAWALPITSLLILNPNRGKNKKAGRDISTVVLSAVIWTIGYAVFWAEKWVITLISPDNTIKKALRQIIFRSGYGKNFMSRINSVNENWMHMSFKPIVLILAIWIVFFMIIIVRRGLSYESRVPSLAIIMLSPVVWYLFASEHSLSHSYFTWRNSLSALFAFWVMICCMTDCDTEKEKVLLKKGVPAVVMSLVCVVISTLAAYVIPVEKADCYNFNYDLTDYATKVVLEPDSEDAISVEFVPQNMILSELTPVIECNDKTITPTLKLYKGDKEIWNGKTKLNKNSNLSEANPWKILKKGDVYRLSVSTEGINETMSVWILEDKRTPEYAINEFSILNGFGYYLPFSDKTRVVFYICTYIMIAISLSTMILMIIGNKKKQSSTD